MKKIKNVLNLDPNYKPFQDEYNEVFFSNRIYSGGELHFEILDDFNDKLKGHTIITNQIKSSDDVMMIALATDALRRKGIKDISLFIPYVPYARQDRVCNSGESFSLKVFANIINSLRFKSVYGVDVHSDVTSALIENFVNIKPHIYIKHVIKNIISTGQKAHDISGGLVLISPDAGANKKVNEFRDNFYKDMKIVYCNKKRDTKTGELNNFEVFCNDLTNKNCLIIDDICDGGRTFIGIAKELKKKNAKNLYLYTTHGIYSQGLTELSENFNGIYSTDSFTDLNSNHLQNYQKIIINAKYLLIKE
jgi:ribose-phosphate pyrophosphokinase